jgi:hypothetical protein
MNDQEDRLAKAESELAALKKRINIMSIVQSFTIIALSLLGIAFSMRGR